MQSGKEKWQAGTQVRLINDPQRIGTLTDGICRLRGSRQLYQVRFNNQPAPQFIPNDQLEPLPEEPMHPLDLLETGKLETPEALRRTLIHVRLTGRLADIIYSMEATDTDFYAYQFKPVLKLLQTPTNSLLIADEVGMGKTIEAGLIWTELRSRFNLKRLVVLCPAALREKWRDELVNKIGVSPEICTAKDTLRILQDRQAHVRGFAIIASIHGLRPRRGWEDAEDDANDVAKLARLLKKKEYEEPLIDLLVVDEAHYMRNSDTQTNRLGQLMRGVSDYLVLLTATPIHNYNHDLFSLLHLLDPDTFERRDDFDEILKANEPLVRVRDLVLKGKSSPDELASVLSEARNNRLLQGNRQLKTLLDQIEDASLDSPTKRSRIAYRLETINLLGHTITRTRKRDVKEWRVVRQPTPEFIPMTEIEREFYDTVTDIVSTYAQENDINKAFLLAQPQRQMASCMPAALKSWKERRRIEIPEDQLSGTDQDDQQRQELGPLTEKLVNNSGEFVAFDDLASRDSKYTRLRKMLQEFFANHPKDKVIVFSTFLGTLDYLKGRLDDDGISSIVLHGRGNRPKYDIIQEFRSPKGPSVMLSSEVGGEGVDLQFSWVVINYDLPWNPMRVEQRIGRVDRLGQESEKVLIWNLFYADTIDARIYECLYDKLDLCRNALGDFEAILGEEIERLTRDLVLGHLSPEQQEERINQTAQALATRRQEEERLEANAAHLVAYGDYILQQVKAAHDMNRWINETDLLAYVTDFLSAHYPGYVLTETDGQNHEYQLSLNSEARHDLSEFIRSKSLSGQTQLEYSTKPIACRFKNRILAGKPERKETISQFHPLVRFISDRISKTVPQLRPAVSVKVARSDLDIPLGLGIYVLAASLWRIKGIRDVEKLVYAAVPLDRPETLLGEDEAERLAITCAAKGRHWLEVGHQCELQQVHNIANEVLFGTLDDHFERYIEEERNQNEDRADIQERHRHRHFSRQKEVIERILKNLIETGKTRVIPATKGRLRSLDDWGERKRREVESRRKITSDREEIFVAIVLIE